MNETQFNTALKELIDGIEQVLDTLEQDLDILRKSEGILEIGFPNGTKIIVSGQSALRQVWLACSAGGFHFVWQDEAWIDTRSNTPLSTILSREVSAQGGGVAVF